MLRRALLSVLILMSAVSLAAQQALPGWKVRVDRSQNAQDPDNVPQLTVAAAGKGFRVTGGPAGTFWRPAETASGNYTVKATFTLLKPSSHVNYYGITFAGSGLEGAQQNYLYFVVAQDGTFQVRQRVADAAQTVQPPTSNDAIKRPDATGRSVNALEVRVAGNTISYVVNGTVVHSSQKTGATAKTDGLAGVRINHVLDVQVDGFEVQKG